MDLIVSLHPRFCKFVGQYMKWFNCFCTGGVFDFVFFSVISGIMIEKRKFPFVLLLNKVMLDLGVDLSESE